MISLCQFPHKEYIFPACKFSQRNASSSRNRSRNCLLWFSVCQLGLPQSTLGLPLLLLRLLVCLRSHRHNKYYFTFWSKFVKCLQSRANFYWTFLGGLLTKYIVPSAVAATFNNSHKFCSFRITSDSINGRIQVCPSPTTHTRSVLKFKILKVEKGIWTNVNINSLSKTLFSHK